MQLSTETQQRAAISGNLPPPERPNLWYRLSAPEPAAANDGLAARERTRRGRVASQIIGGELFALLVVAIDLPLAQAVLPSLVLALVCCAAAIALNRRGHVEATGWLLALSIDAALMWPLLTAQGGLDPIYLPVYYLMVTAPLIAAATLTPATIMPITVVNCVFILVDIRLQPHTMMWNQMITSSSILYSLIVGPIALHVIVALLAYLWTRSATTALKRADRAEEIGWLERREEEQRRSLEQGVQQILATHVRFANGDLTARAPAHQDSALWQVSVALNNLFARYQRLALEDGFSRMASEQVGQARIALRMWQAAQTPAWPPSVGGPLDPLFSDLRQLFTYLPPPRPSGRIAAPGP
ncbi:MAG TPA: hypothetical protein VIC27_04400, partial [Ktedonobacterales bacterium]